MSSKDQPPHTECQKTQIKEVAKLLFHLVKVLVDFPDEVSIKSVAGNHTVVFEVTVAPIDVKRLIGRKGRTADAIRELLLNMGSKAKFRYILEIIEPTFRVHEIPTRQFDASSKETNKTQT